MVAGLAAAADLAARRDPRQRQFDVFRRQCLPARLRHRRRPARPDLERAHGRKFLPATGLADHAGSRRAIGETALGLCRCRRAVAGQPDWNHDGGERRLDRVLVRGVGFRHYGHSGPCPGIAVGAQRAR